MNLEKKRIEQIIDSFAGKKILVIGDIMIDEYLLGKVSRLSPEAPVPVIDINQKTIRFGGAANVALNVKTLGCHPMLVGLTGHDSMCDELFKLLNSHSIESGGIVKSSFRPTTVKTRIIGDNQHIARVDNEVIENANETEHGLLKTRIEDLLDYVDGIILEDYNKGVLTPALIDFIIQKSQSKHIPVCVDPKFTNFMQYRNVSIFKPNIKETEQALAVHLKTEDEIENAGFTLLKSLEAESILLTRGSKGLSLFENKTVTHIPTLARKVADVSGAGDTVISTMMAASVGGATKKEAAILANMAAGIVVEEVGIIPIEKEKLLAVTRQEI